ncbi:MAG: hypothetical protein VB095_12820 [Anaerovorax sp.]|nr:hypothetical protein [Anaerovorax sp.]
MQALTKTIMIDDKPVKFRASALVLRIYRIKFHRDIMQDLVKLKAAHKAKIEDGIDFEVIDLEIFENIAYTMAYHADNSIGSVEDWLDQFGTFSIYEVLPEILGLWIENEMSTVESKKKQNQMAGN